MVAKKCTFSWDTCIGFARTHKENPVEETCMDIFSSTISRRIGYLSKIKHYISAKNCILQRVLKYERIWSKFWTKLISVFLRFKKCVSLRHIRNRLKRNITIFLHLTSHKLFFVKMFCWHLKQYILISWKSMNTR